MRTRSLFLADSSVWIEAFERRIRSSTVRQRVDDLLADDVMATTGLVRLELLFAITDPALYQRRLDLLDGLRQLLTTEERWGEAALLGSQLRGVGVTVPTTDLLIAAVAIDAGATVLHRDRHFDLIAQHAPLLVESYVTPQQI